jgi:hypothetical protein
VSKPLISEKVLRPPAAAPAELIAELRGIMGATRDAADKIYSINIANARNPLRTKAANELATYSAACEIVAPISARFDAITARVEAADPLVRERMTEALATVARSLHTLSTYVRSLADAKVIEQAAECDRVTASVLRSAEAERERADWIRKILEDEDEEGGPAD